MLPLGLPPNFAHSSPVLPDCLPTSSLQPRAAAITRSSPAGAPPRDGCSRRGRPDPFIPPFRPQQPLAFMSVLVIFWINPSMIRRPSLKFLGQAPIPYLSGFALGIKPLRASLLDVSFTSINSHSFLFVDR